MGVWLDDGFNQFGLANYKDNVKGKALLEEGRGHAGSLACSGLQHARASRPARTRLP